MRTSSCCLVAKLGAIFRAASVVCCRFVAAVSLLSRRLWSRPPNRSQPSPPRSRRRASFRIELPDCARAAGPSPASSICAFYLTRRWPSAPPHLPQSTTPQLAPPPPRSPSSRWPGYRPSSRPRDGRAKSSPGRNEVSDYSVLPSYCWGRRVSRRDGNPPPTASCGGGDRRSPTGPRRPYRHTSAGGRPRAERIGTLPPPPPQAAAEGTEEVRSAAIGHAGTHRLAAERRPSASAPCPPPRWD